MIDIRNLAFSYRSEALFSDLGLSLQAGGICGLLGKNGAGKTTLLKLLAGLLFARQGEMRVLGQRPAKRSPGFLQQLLLIPEEFRLPPITPLQYQRLFAPFYPRFDPERFVGYLEEFELNARENLSRCSFGQRKKCLLAFGLAANCRLTLLDEPTNGLDIPSKRQFRRTLAGVLTEDRLFIIATHQVRDLEGLIDPVVILDQGRVIFNRSLEEISRSLRVSVLPEAPGADLALYSEKTVEGYLAVLENATDEETHMDLELLFNSVIHSRERVADVFERRAADVN